MQLPSSTRVLPLARKRLLVPELATALSRAEERKALPLMRLLRRAVVLGRKLEQEVWWGCVSDVVSESSGRLLEAMLDLSLELGKILRKARELWED